MKLSEFNYDYSDDLLAQHLSVARDDCKLMVLHKSTGDLEHRQFRDILDYFKADDLFVMNDTKVFPARLYGRKEKTNALIEVLLLRELKPELHLWDVIVDPARKIRIGNKLYFGEDNSIVAEVIDNTTSRGRTLRFLYDGDHDEFIKQLYALGEAPIPNFLGRPSEPEDLETFQCVYAKNEGAVTAPCTGLHFSKVLMKRMELEDIKSAFLTLHCGIGNFRNTDVEDLTKHKMESEQLIVGKECCELVNRAKDEERRILAVGASTMRGLEVCVGPSGRIKEYEGWINKFIFPPYEFGVATDFVVNFQRPYSIMLMAATAFGGYDQVMHAYDVAVQEGYKVGPFGDALLITD